jgi:DNA topoisomerase-3
MDAFGGRRNQWGAVEDGVGEIFEDLVVLAAVIGGEAVSRPEVVKKLWDYIKAQGLQDPKDKRTILADAKLQAVFGKPSINMFELAGIVGKHLG